MAAPMKKDVSKDKRKTLMYTPPVVPNDELFRFYLTHTKDCEFYKNDYNECKSWKGRMKQEFVYGQDLDCQHLSDAYETCKKWRETKDEDSLSRIVQYEGARAAYRMKSAQENDVWEYRRSPPREWFMAVNYVDGNVKDNPEYDKFFTPPDSVNSPNVNINANTKSNSNTPASVPSDSSKVVSNNNDSKPSVSNGSYCVIS